LALEPFRGPVAQSPQSPPTQLFVDPIRGSDATGTGSDRAPFQTITHALKVAQPYTVIQLAAGVYSAQSGETFPLQVRPKITLQGDPRQPGQGVIVQGQIALNGTLGSPSTLRPPIQRDHSPSQASQIKTELPIAVAPPNTEPLDLPVLAAGAAMPSTAATIPVTHPSTPAIAQRLPTPATSPIIIPVPLTASSLPTATQPQQIGGDTGGLGGAAQTRVTNAPTPTSNLPPVIVSRNPVFRPSNSTATLARAGLSGFRYRVVVEVGDGSQKIRLRSLVPDSFRSSYQGRAVMQVGVYREQEQAKVNEMAQRLSSNGFNPIVETLPVSTVARATQPQQISSRLGQQTNLESVLVPVPAATIPIGNAGNLPPTVTRGSSSPDSPPPPPTRVTLLGFRYRVVVEVGDGSQKIRLRSLVPDSFRSSYQGRAVMQVGAYREQEQAKVNEMTQRLSSNGFNPIVEQLR